LGGSGYSLPIWTSPKGGLSGIIGVTRISVDGQTGEFSGAFLPPGQLRTVSFAGVLRPASNDGLGVIRGPSEAAQVLLTPQ
jgi:hypothetical protein